MATSSGWAGRLGSAIGTPWVRTVAVLAVAQIVSELGFSFALPFTPLYVQELGVSDLTEAGLWAGAMAGAFSVVMGVMAPVWGTVADRFGHKLMIQRAFFGAGASIVGMSFVQTPEQLLALRTFQGALTGVITAILTLVSLTVPRRYLGTVLGLMQACVFLGVSLGPLVGGVFADRFGLRAAFMVGGAILFTTGMLVTLFVSEPARARRKRESAQPSGRAERLPRRELLAVVLLMALTRFANVAPQPVLPLFVQQLLEETGRLGTIVGLVLAVTGIASTVSALLAGRLTDRFGRRPTILVCLVVAAVVSPLHALVDSVWQLVVLRTVTGLALGGMGPPIQALLVDVTPSGRRGAAFGLLQTANSTGNGAGPVVGSVVAAGFGVPAVFVAMLPVFVVAAAVVSRVRPTKGAGTTVVE